MSTWRESHLHLLLKWYRLKPLWVIYIPVDTYIPASLSCVLHFDVSLTHLFKCPCINILDIQWFDTLKLVIVIVCMDGCFPCVYLCMSCTCSASRVAHIELELQNLWSAVWVLRNWTQVFSKEHQVLLTLNYLLYPLVTLIYITGTFINSLTIEMFNLNQIYISIAIKS